MATKEQFEKAFKEFMDKTDWVQGDKRFEFLLPWGKHRADILKAYIEHLEQRAEVAEAKLAELDKQEPVSSTTKAQLDIIADGSVGSMFASKDMPVKLFTRPAPAINLAELVPDERSYKDIDCHLTDFGKAISAQGWNDCRAAILRNIEEAK